MAIKGLYPGTPAKWGDWNGSIGEGYLNDYYWDKSHKKKKRKKSNNKNKKNSKRS